MAEYFEVQGLRSQRVAVVSEELGAPLVTYRSSDAAGVMTVDIYSRLDLERPTAPQRFERLFFARLSRPAEGVAAELWSDSRTCPALIGVLASAQDLFAPRFEFGPLHGAPPQGAGVRYALPAPPDGQPVTVRGRARQADGTSAEMSVTSSSGLIAEFGRYATDQLAECWKAEKPF